MQNLSLSYNAAPSAFGRVHLVANETHLLVLAMSENWPRIKEKIEARATRSGFKIKFERDANAILERTLRELQEFADGRRKTFTVPIAPAGTAFEKEAWSELRKIPFGKTRTYLDQAEKLKKPQAVRAVGVANSRNPILILIPCHRVISVSGSLTGYSGGLALKKRLLTLERAL